MLFQPTSIKLLFKQSVTKRAGTWITSMKSYATMDKTLATGYIKVSCFLCISSLGVGSWVQIPASSWSSCDLGHVDVTNTTANTIFDPHCCLHMIPRGSPVGEREAIIFVIFLSELPFSWLISTHLLALLWLASHHSKPRHCLTVLQHPHLTSLGLLFPSLPQFSSLP